MIKTISYIVLSSLASLIIMVHAVIPHHHHDDRVCFELANHHVQSADQGIHHGSSCCDHDLEHKQPTDQNECQLPEDSNQHSCHLISELLICQHGWQRHVITCPVRDMNSPNKLQQIITVACLSEPGEIYLSCLPFRQRPIPITYGLTGPAQVPGLRAPPVI